MSEGKAFIGIASSSPTKLSPLTGKASSAPIKDSSLPRKGYSLVHYEWETGDIVDGKGGILIVFEEGLGGKDVVIVGFGGLLPRVGNA